MLTSAETINVVASSLQEHKITTIVVDPVCILLRTYSHNSYVFTFTGLMCFLIGYGVDEWL